jgi:hypothetical protein
MARGPSTPVGSRVISTKWRMSRWSPRRLAGRQCRVAGPRSGQSRGSLFTRDCRGVIPQMTPGSSAPLTARLLALVARGLTLLSEAPPRTAPLTAASDGGRLGYLARPATGPGHRPWLAVCHASAPICARGKPVDANT